MQRTAPPFRADHVGSLLRPAVVKDARAKLQRGEITADALRVIEDCEIERAIGKQEEIGLKLATDGELRRSWYQFDFLKGLKGVELYQVDEGITFSWRENQGPRVYVPSTASIFRRTRTSTTSASSRPTRASRRK